MSEFKRIPHIPTSDKLADIIFSKLSKIRVDTPKHAKKKRSDTSFFKTLYFRQFRTLFPEIDERLISITESFPILDDLHPFYKELIEISFGIDKLRTSLSRINNSRKAIASIERDVSKKLGRSATASDAKSVRREAIGRVGSAINKLKEPLNDLIDAKVQLSKLPDFNLNEKTIAFAGAPNVGKSSFVTLVSTGKPEIASYPFTTKELVCGHRKHGFTAIQLIDTPGLLDRPLDERNLIEMKSILALKHLADAIVFLYDPTIEAPLTIEHQFNLHNDIKEKFPELPIYSFINKSDIITKERLEEVKEVVGELNVIATIESNKPQLEKIILNIIEKIPEKKLFVREKPILEDVEVKEKTDEIEWIFFDNDNEN